MTVEKGGKDAGLLTNQPGMSTMGGGWFDYRVFVLQQVQDERIYLISEPGRHPAIHTLQGVFLMEVREVAEMLLAQGKRVSVAEADTAGLVGYLLGTIPGSSQFFPGGVIAYTGGLKQSILGVSDELYESKGSVCAEMAIAMARGVRELTGTDYAVSTTGVTGPGAGRSGLPLGTFYIGLADREGNDVAIHLQLDGDRDANKRGAAQAAIDLLGRRLQGEQ